jgi:signal transduction histidine kinase/CheY-like chemotaxis protein
MTFRKPNSDAHPPGCEVEDTCAIIQKLARERDELVRTTRLLEIRKLRLDAEITELTEAQDAATQVTRTIARANLPGDSQVRELDAPIATPAPVGDARVSDDSPGLRLVDAQFVEENTLLLEKLERSNEELRSFAHTAAHDLKGPLTSILGFADVVVRLHGDGLGAHGRAKMNRIRRATVRMSDLVNSLLRYATADQAPAQRQDVCLKAATSEVVTDLSVLISESDAEVDIGELPTIQADPVMLRQLLQNLIGNAIKYRKPGVPPVVKVNGTVDATNGECTFTVSDNGIGFEQGDADTVFQPFARLVPRGQFEGSGIGMATAKKIVDSHQGTIAASGSPGVGAVFTIELPARGQPAAESRTSIVSDNVANPPDRQSARLLLVDDDEELLELYQLTFGEVFQVQVAASAREAVQLLKTVSFDVVLSDFEMPQQNGAWLLAHVRKHHPNVRRLLMSSLERSCVEEHLDGDLVEQFSQKPVDVADVAALLGVSKEADKTSGD